MAHTFYFNPINFVMIEFKFFGKFIGSLSNYFKMFDKSKESNRIRYYFFVGIFLTERNYRT